MIQPVQHACYVMYLRPRRQGRAVDHDHWQAQRAGRCQFRRSPGSASVFRHDQINPVRLHQRTVAFRGEWAAIDDHMRLRQGQRGLGWVYQPQKVEMLRLGRKSGQILPPDGQHHAARAACKCSNCTRDIGHLMPIIFRLRTPWRAGQGQIGQGLGAASSQSVAAHLSGERMRGVDHMGDLLGVQIAAQSFDPTKAAYALWKGLAQGAFDATGQREYAVNPGLCHGFAQGTGFGGAAKDEKAFSHV